MDALREAPAGGAEKLGKRASIKDLVTHALRFLGRRANEFAAFSVFAVVSACDQVPSGGLPFAAPSAGTDRLTAVAMDGADIVLAAPAGYCFDKKMLRRDAADGFALLPRCDRLGVRGVFASFGKSAVITATLGKAADGRASPSLSELAASVPGAHVLEARNGGTLPLVKLDMPDHGARGASSEHWRGAFVQDGYVILLALYAPEQSPLLDARGADLLDQMAQRTRAASALQPVVATSVSPPVTTHLPRRIPSGALRPVARGDREQQAKAPLKSGGGTNLSLTERIAGLFD